MRRKKTEIKNGNLLINSGLIIMMLDFTIIDKHYFFVKFVMYIISILFIKVGCMKITYWALYEGNKKLIEKRHKDLYKFMKATGRITDKEEEEEFWRSNRA